MDDRDDRDGRDQVEDVPTSQEGATDASEAPIRIPASRNPWYILATVHGEQSGRSFLPNLDLHARNRNTWNRWMAASLDDAERAILVEKHGHDPEDLVPLDPEERAEIQALAADRLAEAGVTLPESGADVDFRNVDFSASFFANGFLFPGPATFEGATFRKWTQFEGATFRAEAQFAGATFRETARFNGATFQDGAQFAGATFRAEAQFAGATFWGEASFQQTDFKAATDFDDSRFGRSPDFRDAKLPFSTTWRRIVWPAPSSRTAEDDVEHYAALRHAMDTAKRHDAELDFFVRELQARRHTPQPLLRRLALDGYLLLSDGGRSFGRPALAWLFGTALSVVLHAPLDRGYVDLPAKTALEMVAAVLGNAFVVSATAFDRRKIDRLSEKFQIDIPGWLQLFDIAHVGFSALCLFLMALAVRNWLRLR